MYISHYFPDENMTRFAYITSEYKGGWVKVFVFGTETTVVNKDGIPTKRWRPFAGYGSFEMFQRSVKHGVEAYLWRYDNKKEYYLPVKVLPELLKELHSEVQEQWDSIQEQRVNRL